MGTVIIGGGPRPTSNIYAVSPVSDSGDVVAPATYEIREGDEVLARCKMICHAIKLLPLIRSGE